MKPKYINAIQWVAFNDDPSVLNVKQIEESITVQLIADVFGKNSLDVARDIYQLRIDDMQEGQ